MAQFLRESGPQSAVSATAARKAKGLETRREALVGTNMYPNLKEVPLQAPSVDYEALGQNRAARTKAHRLAGHRSLSRDRLREFSVEFGNGSRDPVQKAKDAVLAGATLGDLWEVLGSIEDRGPSIQPLRIHRASERFETLRRRAEEIPAQKGIRPVVFIASIGSPAALKPRADFSKAFFEVGGFEVLGNDDVFENTEDAARAVLASGALIAAVCSTDEAYPELIPRLAGTLKKSSPNIMVLVAGKPAADREQIYREAGVDDFFFVGVNCYELLSALQERAYQ
jgi:methylmalonyl-CoA mutase